MKWTKFRMSILPVAILIASAIIAGCTTQATESQLQEIPAQIIKDVTPQEASVLIDKNIDNPDFVIIDVRTPEEFADGYIANAVNIDFNSKSIFDRGINRLAKTINIDVQSSRFRRAINRLEKNRTYLVYCRGGGRSRNALNIMAELNFREVYNMLGGIKQWESEGLPTVK